MLQWFISTDGDQDVAEIIKEEIWKNPVQYFGMVRFELASRMRIYRLA